MPPKCAPDNCMRSTGSPEQVLQGLAERTEKGGFTAATLLQRREGSRNAARASPAFSWHKRATDAYCELVKAIRDVRRAYRATTAEDARAALDRAAPHMNAVRRKLQTVVGRKTWRPIAHALGQLTLPDLSAADIQRARQLCADSGEVDEAEARDAPDAPEVVDAPPPSGAGPSGKGARRRRMVVETRDPYDLRPRVASSSVPVEGPQASRLERQRARGARKYPLRTDEQRETVRTQMRAQRDDGRPRMTPAESLARARAAKARKARKARKGRKA